MTCTCTRTSRIALGHWQDELSPLIGKLRNELKPFLEVIISNQNASKKRLHRQEELTAALAEDVRVLRNWVVNDTISKLKA